MKDSSRSLVVLATLLALLLLSGAARVQAQDEQCLEADRLRLAGRYDAAAAAYHVLLSRRDAPPCAQEGLLLIEQARDTALASYEEGRALEEAGEVAAAIEAYVAATLVDPSFMRAHLALIRLQADPFAGVRQLAEQGMYGAASDLLIETVRENPGLEVPRDLAYLSEGKPYLWPAGQRWLSRWLVPGLIALFALWLLFLTALALIVGAIVWARSLFRRYLEIEPFVAGNEGGAGSGVASLLEERLAAQTSPWRLDMVSGDVTSFTVPATLRRGNRGLWALRLLELIPPRQVVVVNGALLEAGEQGPGLSLSLLQGTSGRVLAGQALWHDELYEPVEGEGTAAPFYRLTDSAADYLVYRLWSS